MNSSKTIYGFHAVTSRVRLSVSGLNEIYLDAQRQDQRAQALIKAAQEKDIRVILVDAARLDGMVGTRRHQGVVAVVSAAVQAVHRSLDELIENLSEPALLLVLDGVQDPHNLGACFRVADAMGAHALIAPKDRAVGVTPTVRKVASGAAESVPFFSVTNLARTLEGLKDLNIWIAGADSGGDQDLLTAKLDGAVAWVLGAEGQGLRRLTRERCDYLVSIPMFGDVESLNVSVAAGICLYETRRQRVNRPA